jgi:hypothetical protein
MSEAEKLNLDNVKVDTANLYREEMVTDMKVASLQVMVPIKPNGEDDTSRERIFVCQTQLMTRGGVLPVSAPTEAKSLEEAIRLFPETIKQAVDTMVEEAREYQRQEASRIVVPSAGNPGVLPGGLQGDPLRGTPGGQISLT